MTGPFKRDGTTIYVPLADSPLRELIEAGSGIVGTPQPGTELVLIDYEGAIYGQAGLETYEARVYHAWSRHTWGENGYPTIARAVVKDEELIEVGFLLPEDPDQHARPRVVIDRQDLVDEWCAAVTS